MRPAISLIELPFATLRKMELFCANPGLADERVPLARFGCAPEDIGIIVAAGAHSFHPTEGA